MSDVGRKLGRYRIEEEIGAGGMGVVYRAFDEKLERELAIKVIAPGALNDEASRKRFRNEAFILSRLNHPSIQTIHDFDTFDEQDYLVSELVQGVSLDTRLRSGSLREKEVIELGLQLAEGLAAAHKAGVLHRDLKPANLRVTPDGRLKILDFGLATFSREAVLNLSTTQITLDASPAFAGTLPYMSPEQLLAEQIDERSDVYSAGIVLFELSTGHLPFADSLVPKLTNAIVNQTPQPLRKLVPSLSAEFERIVLKCLEKDRALRYQSAKELVSDLRRLQLLSSARQSDTHPESNFRKWMAPLAVGVATTLTVSAILLWRSNLARKAASAPALRWERLTNFDDAAEIPALSPDGQSVAFLRGSGDFGTSTNDGQIWIKSLLSGETVQLTKTPYRKQTINFSLDGKALYFTQIEGAFAWNTYEQALLGGQEPRLFMPNATGLSWLGQDRVLFSTIESGIHMKLATSNSARTNERDIYVPDDHSQGMVHRSAVSPDGKFVLLAEMDREWWGPCRLVPFDASSTGHQVGPGGSCTWAEWSPDGKWMYFTVDTRDSGFHIWRQRFPDGQPQQLTPSGASEEEGLAVALDGKSLITASGTQESSVWLYDEKNGPRPITREGFALLPVLSPDGKRVYYLRRTPNSHSYFGGELWMSDVASGVAQHLFEGLVLKHFAISQDGKKIVFATEENKSGSASGIWIAWLDRTQPPRQLTSGGESRAFFGKQGAIFYQDNQAPSKIMRIKEDGTGSTVASDFPIMQLQGVSPDGRWAVAGITPTNGHGDRNTMIVAVSLEGRDPVTICDVCNRGFGTARNSSPLLSWSLDGKWMYVSLRHFSFGSSRTVVFPIQPGADPPDFTKDFKSEADFARIPAARLLNMNDVSPGLSPGYFVNTRRSAKANLFRIYLEP